jgi:hypothetical protein
MKIRLSFLALFFFVVTAQAVTVDSIAKLGLPVLNIITIDGEEPTCDYAFAPEGAWGITTINQTKVKGRCLLIQKGDTLFDSGEYLKDKSGMTLRIRGNTSAYYSEKNPFKLKLEKKNDLLARGDSCYYDKNWVLLSTGDCLYTLFGNKVNELMGMPWTPAFIFVNLIVNDDYRGLYMISEQVRRNADCRLNVDKKTGFIIERDAYWWNEDVYFKTNLYEKEFTFKYPEPEDVTDEQTAYITDYLNRFEESISTGRYTDYIDLKSWVSWIIAHDVLGTWDAGGANIFMTKFNNEDDSLLHMTTLWDFGSIMKQQKSWSEIHDNGFFYYPLLFNNGEMAFNDAYINRYDELFPDIFVELENFFDDFEASETAQGLEASYPHEYARWRYNDGTLANKIRAIREWLDNRSKGLDEAVHSIPTSLHVEQYRQQRTATPVNLFGQPVDPQTYRGIIIKNGKKVLVK